MDFMMSVCNTHQANSQDDYGFFCDLEAGYDNPKILIRYRGQTKQEYSKYFDHESLYYLYVIYVSMILLAFLREIVFNPYR